MNSVKLQSLLDQRIDQKTVFGVILSINKNGEEWSGSSGNLMINQPYFIASTTKLYVTALILLLRQKGKIQLEDKIGSYLPDHVMRNLHVYKGTDFSGQITVKQLLSQTSGLPDYFEGKGENGKSLLQEITSGYDQYWSFEQAISKAKGMKPIFKPGAEAKAHYSDTNFQLLGKIIEEIQGKEVGEVMEEMIFRPLGLKNTYLYKDDQDSIPALMYYKNKPLNIRKAMTSFGPDGGIVSTAEESMKFLVAFFSGIFFPKDNLEELYAWNKIMFPLEYGVGIMRFKLPRLFSPFKALPAFIGHSGLSGAFAYYIPKQDLYLSGTINQIHKPATSYKMLLKIVNSIN